MTVIDLRIVVPESSIDPTSDYGLNEKAYIAIANALGTEGIGEILDCRPIASQN